MPDYSVKLSNRLTDIVGQIEELNQDTNLTLVYSFTNGYEKLDIKRNDMGGLSFAGSYHPNGYCEGGGVCKYCGCTL